MRVQDRKISVMSTKINCLFPFTYELDVLEQLKRFCRKIIILYCYILLFFFFLLLNYFHMLLRGKSFLSLTSSFDPRSGGSCRKAIVLCIKAPGALGTLIHLPCRWRSQSVSRSGMSDLCDYMDYSPAGSSVYGILQARILEWVAIPFSRGSSQPRDQTWVSCIGRQILYHLSHQEGHLVCELDLYVN